MVANVVNLSAHIKDIEKESSAREHPYKKQTQLKYQWNVNSVFKTDKIYFFANSLLSFELNFMLV